MTSADDKLIQEKNIHSSGLSIRGRLFVGFAIIISTFILSTLITLYLLADIKHTAEEFFVNEMPVTHSLIDIENNLIESQIIIQQMILLGKSDNKEKFNSIWKSINTRLVGVDKQSIASEDRGFSAKWAKVKIEINKIYQIQVQIIGLSEGGKNDLALNLYKDTLLSLYAKVTAQFNIDHPEEVGESGILDDRSDFIISGMNVIITDIKDITTSTLIFLAVCSLLSVLISYLTANKILAPIRYAIDIAKRIASGSRDVSISIISKDETASLLHSLDIMQSAIKESEQELQRKAAETKALFDSVIKSANIFSAHTSRVAAGDLTKRLVLDKNDSNVAMTALGNDLNTMTDNLSSIAGEITTACVNMVSTLDEVRHSVDAQSAGANEQASSINEITASISEIEKSAAQTMLKSKSLGEVAAKTREKGQLGLEAVEQSIAGMKTVREKVQLIAQTILDLSRQTQQVGEITVVVNNLAQQSKMLALNASIEAAKAGEAGKGFAVVANEVKNLAEQSEQSTTQVQKILEDIKHATENAVMVTEEGAKGVDTGMLLVEQTGNVIRALNEVIHETTIATQQIEAAVRQESSGIEQINAGMNEINQVTASFVESVRETTEAMNDLAKISQNLKVSIDTYKV